MTMLFQSTFSPPPKRPMSWILTLILLLSLHWLTGCSTPTVEYIPTPPRVPPKVLLSECEPIPPVTLEQLLNAQLEYPQSTSHWEAISLLLTDAWEQQTVRLGLCNNKIVKLNEWYDQHNTPLTEKINDSGGGVNLTR